MIYIDVSAKAVLILEILIAFGTYSLIVVVGIMTNADMFEKIGFVTDDFQTKWTGSATEAF